MTLNETLLTHLEAGPTQIGQIRITPSPEGYELTHCDETLPDGDLQCHTTVQEARAVALYGKDDEYRFTKGQLDLKTGWKFIVPDISSLRLILDAFYPASLGLWKAWKDGSVRIQNLRDKLSRQTGMYRYAGTVSNEGAQDLVSSLCGPGNNCVKRILWQIDAETPLDDTPASRFDGTLPHKDRQVIPLVCQEACNFFVAQCRKRAKKEFEAKSASD